VCARDSRTANHQTCSHAEQAFLLASRKTRLCVGHAQTCVCMFVFVHLLTKTANKEWRTAVLETRPVTRTPDLRFVSYTRMTPNLLAQQRHISGGVFAAVHYAGRHDGPPLASHMEHGEDAVQGIRPRLQAHHAYVCNRWCVCVEFAMLPYVGCATRVKCVCEGYMHQGVGLYVCTIRMNYPCMCMCLSSRSTHSAFSSPASTQQTHTAPRLVWSQGTHSCIMMLMSTHRTSTAASSGHGGRCILASYVVMYA